MIQDIAPHRLDNRFLPDIKPGKDSLIVSFDGALPYVREGPCCPFPELRDVPAAPEKLTYLFRTDGRELFYYPEKLPETDSYRYISPSLLRKKKTIPREWMFSVYTAGQLCRWLRDNRFCGTCGTETVPHSSERALRCPACGRVIYPRIQPAVIVGVISGECLLLTRYADRPFTQNALVAGFVEIGETLEDTVRREVWEETGLSVKNIRYYKSQPWATADDLLAGFFCDLDGQKEIRLDGELSSAIFTPRHEIVCQEDDYSLTNEMMTVFKEGRIKI